MALEAVDVGCERDPDRCPPHLSLAGGRSLAAARPAAPSLLLGFGSASPPSSRIAAKAESSPNRGEPVLPRPLGSDTGKNVGLAMGLETRTDDKCCWQIGEAEGGSH